MQSVDQNPHSYQSNYSHNILQSRLLSNQTSYDHQQLMEMCNKHPSKQSSYYISQEPWIKFCSKCALNYALCGKKIQRRLSQEQVQKKNQLENTMQDLRLNIKNGQQKQGRLQIKLDTIQLNYINKFEKIIRFYDANIQEWTKQRNQIYKIYSTEILQYRNSLQELRSKLMFTSLELKKSLQDIQTNFGMIIHQLDLKNFNTSIKSYKDNLISMISDIKISDRQSQYEVKQAKFEKILEEVNTKTDTFINNQLLLIKSIQKTSEKASSVQQSCTSEISETKEINLESNTQKRNALVLQEQNYKEEMNTNLKLKLKGVSQSSTNSNSKVRLTDNRIRRTDSKLSIRNQNPNNMHPNSKQNFIKASMRDKIL